MAGKLKVGVIGVGRMGERHVWTYKQMPGVEVTAVADSDVRRAEAIAKQYQVAEAYGEYEQLLSRSKVDAVSIATPDDYHVGPTVASTQAGKHVLLEKPIATKLEDADVIVSAAQRARVKLMLGYTARFFPQFRQAKETISSGRIGNVLLGRVAWLNCQPSFPPEFKTTGLPPRRDSIITFLAVHPIDLLCWYMGDEVERVYCEADTFTWGKKEGGPHDTASIQLRFRSGMIGSIVVSWGFSGARFTARFMTDIVGQEGLVQCDSLNDGLVVSSIDHGYELPIHYDWREALRAELAHFVDCVQQDTLPVVSGDDGRRTLAVALAAIESARTKKVVHL